MVFPLARLFSVTTVVFVILAACSQPLLAQKEKFDAKKYLQRLDKNGNSIIEPGEMAGGTTKFLKTLGFDPTRPIKIGSIVGKINNDRADKAKQQRRDSIVIKVPGFGVETERVGVSSFSGEPGEEDAAAMEKKYGQKVLARVDDTIGRYDKNGNGRLDPNEVQKARWGSPTPQESDLNKDGSLSRSELANRYLNREQERNRSSNRSRSAMNSRTVVLNSTPASRKTSAPKASRKSSLKSLKRTPRKSTRSTNKTSGFNSGNDRFLKYAEGLIKNYDKNGDGKIDKAELTEMRRPPKNADPNNDGFITKAELAAALSGKTTESSKTNSAKSDFSSSKTVDRKSNRSDEPTSRRTPSSSFTGTDENGDGQILMHEFSSEWDADVVAEFQRRDLNGDGVITAKEWNDSK